MKGVSFFECTLMSRPWEGAPMEPCKTGGEEFSSTIAAHSAGAARYQYLRSLQDLCYTVLDGRDYVEVTFRHIRVRKTNSLSMPVLAAFADTAEKRGLPFARIGMRVEMIGGRSGVIVGKNDSANFQVLFDDGIERSCHPRWGIAYLAADGTVLADFRKEIA